MNCDTALLHGYTCDMLEAYGADCAGCTCPQQAKECNKWLCITSEEQTCLEMGQAGFGCHWVWSVDHGECHNNICITEQAKECAEAFGKSDWVEECASDAASTVAATTTPAEETATDAPTTTSSKYSNWFDVLLDDLTSLAQVILYPLTKLLDEIFKRLEQ